MFWFMALIYPNKYNIPRNIIHYKIVYKFMCNLVAAKWLLENVQYAIYADYMW